jgi:hypothetical protein
VAKGEKTFFAPLPLRAISDQRLSGLHFRVLAMVAFHDRMSARRKTGAGCWASHKTMCAEIGCNYTNLSTALTDLGKWGYLERHVHPLNKRLRVYNVNYDSLPTDKQSGAQLCQETNDQPAIVCQPKRQDVEGTEDSLRNIFPKGDNRFCRNREKDTPEGASLSIDAQLAIFERQFKQAACTKQQIEDGSNLCKQIIDNVQVGEGLWRRANRLLGEIEGIE